MEAQTSALNVPQLTPDAGLKVTDADVEAMADSEDVAVKSIVRRLAGLPVRGRAGKRADRAIARWRAGQLHPQRGERAA